MVRDLHCQMVICAIFAQDNHKPILDLQETVSVMTKMSGNNFASGETTAWLQVVISKHDKH